MPRTSDREKLLIKEYLTEPGSFDNSGTPVMADNYFDAIVDLKEICDSLGGDIGDIHDEVTLASDDTTQETLNLTDQEISVNLVTTSTDGVMSSADKTKLDGIEVGAEVNPTLKTVGGQSIIGVGDIMIDGGSSIDDNSIANVKLLEVDTNTIKGRATSGTGVVEDLNATQVKTILELDNVENIELSTWAGSSNIVTLGTIATGAWNATAISVSKGGTGNTAMGTATQKAIVNSGATGLTYVDDIFTKSITIVDPTSSENLTLFYTTEALTVLHAAESVSGSGPSVTYNIRWAPARNEGLPVSLFGTNRAVSAQAGTTTTTFNNTTIPANSFVWIITSAKSGTVSDFHVSLKFKR